LQKRIVIVGAGHVGLVSAACYAQAGSCVAVYEKDQTKRGIIASGRSWFYEPSLDGMLRNLKKTGRMTVVSDPVSAVGSSDLAIVAVGTPTRRDGTADLSDLARACRGIARGVKLASHYVLVVIRSTVLPGTTSRLIRRTLERVSRKKAGRDFGLVVFPEFLREGMAVHDTIHPSRIVIGELDRRSGNALERFLKEFYGRDLPPLIRVNMATAEMIKCVSNAFLATKVSFINETANLCERLDNVDVDCVADGMGYDHRIGRDFLNAGPGFGGSCLPKDLKTLVKGAKHFRVRLRVAEAALATNELQPLRLIRVVHELVGNPRGKKVAVLGLSFKPSTSDMRVAPSVKIIRALVKTGMRVKVYDPKATENAKSLFGDTVAYASNVRDCLEQADCCLILTEWGEFSALTAALFVQTMKKPVVVDGRRVLKSLSLDPRIVYRALGIGRQVSDAIASRNCTMRREHPNRSTGPRHLI